MTPGWPQVPLMYLFGSFPSSEESVTVLPATFQSLKVWIRMVCEQVLFQMIYNAKYQRATVPLGRKTTKGEGERVEETRNRH